MKKNIAIIMGGYSSEYKISLLSGNVVYDYLDKEKFHVYRIHILKDKWVYIDGEQEEHPVNKHDFSVALSTGALRFDCVFNAIHGTPGEDGLMQAYFQIIGLPQTSCDYYQAALTFNKRDLLSVLKPFGIKSATAYYLNQGDNVSEDDIINRVGLPCFVKANRSGSSFGITKVYHREEMADALKTAFLEDDEVLIESFLKGTEVSVGVIKYGGKTKVLPITEIVSDNDFFDYAAKYEGQSQEITPARITKDQENNVIQVAKQIYEVLKMKGYTRSEFIFVGDDPYLLEVNTTPGLTTRSILPQQAEAAGISLSELFESSIWEALGENN